MIFWTITASFFLSMFVLAILGFVLFLHGERFGYYEK